MTNSRLPYTSRPIEFRVVISNQLAEKIFKMLVNVCRCNKGVKKQFIRWATDGLAGREFRFGGMFGMTGKIWIDDDGIRISGPSDSELDDLQYRDPSRDELELALVEANRHLALLIEIDPLVEVTGDPLLPT